MVDEVTLTFLCCLNLIGPDNALYPLRLPRQHLSLAEAALRDEARRRGLDLIIDSAGNWHAGEPPDPRAVATAARNGVDITALRARQVTRGDFTRFDHIVALDHNNLNDLRRLAPADATARLSLLLDHVPGREGQPVADPWFGGAEGFEFVWAEVTVAARGLLNSLTH